MILREYLRLNDITATELSRQIGVSHSTVLRWAGGTMQPSPPWMRKLHEISGGQITPNDFLIVDGQGIAA